MSFHLANDPAANVRLLGAFVEPMHQGLITQSYSSAASDAPRNAYGIPLHQQCAQDFSLIGLSQSPGLKWVASFDGFPMIEVRSVYLAHSFDDGGLIVVKTANRQRWVDDHGGENPRVDPEEMRTRLLETFVSRIAKGVWANGHSREVSARMVSCD